MVFNNIYETTITFIINGSSYVLHQNPETEITFEDPREIAMVRDLMGSRPVTYGTNMQEAVTVEFEAIMVGKSVATLLDTTFQKNLVNDSDYLFTIKIVGKNSLGEDVTVKLENCILRQRPIQASLGQQTPVLKISVKCSQMTWS